MIFILVVTQSNSSVTQDNEWKFVNNTGDGGVVNYRYAIGKLQIFALQVNCFTP